MKGLTLVLIGAAVFVALDPAVAWAQYRTPLRYDLRYTSPTYIPSGTLRYGPPRQADPYRFGNPLHGNLGVTGNLRLGKSFQGNTPYVQSGSQLTDVLPSNRLSDFRRDSIGLEDLGTGLEYGQIGTYYPDMGTVTTPWTAGRRFDASRFQDRVRYLPPNYNVETTGPLQSPDNIFRSPGGWTGLSLDAPPGEIGGRYSLGVGEDPEEIAAALRTMASIPRAEEDDGTWEEIPEEDLLQTPYDVFEKRFRTPPVNVFSDEPARQGESQESEYERTMKLQYVPEVSELDSWSQPLPDDEDFLEEPAADASEEEKATRRWDPGPLWPVENSSDADNPWAEMEAGSPLAGGEGLHTESARQSPPVPAMPTSGYGRYVLRGHEALRQGQFGLAESQYAAAVALERDRPAAFFGRVHALLGSGLYLQAAAVLERRLAEHPEWAKQAPDLTAVYARKDVADRIRREIKREVDRGSSQAGYRLLLAYVELAAGHADEARPYLTEVADPTPAEKAMLEAIGTK